MGLFTKTKNNGYAVTKERAKELEKNFSLFGYTSDKVKKGDKTPILLHDGFNDAFEIIEYFKLNPEDCVVVLGKNENHRDPLTQPPICPKNLAGVLNPNRNDRRVFFPDGVGEDTELYNVIPVDSKNERLHVSKKQFKLFTIPSKVELFHILFGKGEREKNKRLENYLLSLNTYIKKDSLYFYLVMRASSEVKKNLISFKEQFLQVREKTITGKRVYPRMPDIYDGPSSGYDALLKQSKEGVLTGFLDIKAFYDILAESNEELKSLLDLEYKRIEFVNKFKKLEDLLKYGDYNYIPITSITHEVNSSEYFNITSNGYFWSVLIAELNAFYTEGLASKHNYADDYRIFNYIADKMMYGELSDDEEKISFVNFDSSKTFLQQLEKKATYTFVKNMTIDSQNVELVSIAQKAVENKFKSVLEKEVKTGFIKSTAYEIL